MKTMDFRSEFRKICQRECQDDSIAIMPGLKMQCGFEKIFILFLNPSEHGNIEKIAMKYLVAARKVQEWIKEEAAYSDVQGDRPVTPEGRDTNSGKDTADQTAAEKGDRSVTLSENKTQTILQGTADLLRYAKMPQAELDAVFDTGCFNEIALGYLTLALQAMGMEADTVQAAQKAMSRAFDQSDAAAARKAYLQ